MGLTIWESFGLNLKVMRVFGLYPPRRHVQLYRIYSCVLYLLFIVPVPALGCFYLLTRQNVDMVVVADNAFLFAEMGCYIVKFLPFILNGGEIKKCINFFGSCQFNSVVKSYDEVVGECGRVCRRNTLVFLISVAGGVASWAVKPLLLRTGKLPADIWVPFDLSSNFLGYLSVYCYLLTSVTYAAFSSGVTNPLLAGLACHASCHLQILKQNLTKLSLDPSGLESKIKQYVNHHSAILNFVQLYEKCFSLVVFSQFAGSVVVICVSLLELTMIEAFTFNFFAMVSYLVTMLAEIYLFCYYGTVLSDESSTISQAVYMGNWYNCDLNSRRSLMLIMERSKKPINITAGKILDLSLVTFSTILRRAYSLLAVLENY